MMISNPTPASAARPKPPVTARAGADPLSVRVTAEGVAIVTYDVAGESVNTVRADFADAFTRCGHAVDDNPDVRAAVLLSGKPDSFIVGADVGMLETIASRDDAVAMVRRGHDALGRLAGSRKPWVAAIHGAALGGGFEIALACQGRVLSSSDKTMVGFPEVKLGLLPGLSGLQRLAALAGLATALEYGLSGKNLRANKAAALGVADEVVPRAIVEQVAIEHALALAGGSRARPRRTPALAARLRTLALEDNPLGRAVVFKQARGRVAKMTGGHYPAPGRIIDLLEHYAAEGFEASQAREAEAFADLLMSEQSVALRSVFFATTALKKDSGVDDPKVSSLPVEQIAVLGAGLMGAGIAAVSIDKGLGVRLRDVDDRAVARGLGHISKGLDAKLRRRHIVAAGKSERLARLSTTTDYQGMSTTPLVIEAVFEELAVKQQVLREVEAACKPGVIFASNTSSIPIARIAEASRAPERVVGMHYFSPVEKMPLLEVIRTEQTADEVVATAVAVGKRQGKTVIVVRDGVGFYTSRILAPYMNEASYLLSEGASVEQVDAALTAWGFPVGPITLLDEVGIDVAAHVGPIMVGAFGERMAPPPTGERLVEDGRKGRKNGRGFYSYGEAAPKKGKRVDATVYETLGLPVPDPKAEPVVPAGEIQQRCSLQMINEALHCWGEGVLRSPRDGDIGAIFGLGFPPFTGGPFRYLDRIGADRLLSQMEAYQDRFGARFTPAPALVDLARSGKRCYR